jgi:ligand-binding sensor domain-containing protein
MCGIDDLMLWRNRGRYTICILLLLLWYAPLMAQEPPAISYSFRHLSIKDGLASNHVSAILQDRKGFIWIASTALQRYDGTNLVTVATFDKVPGSIYYDDICLCEDHKGRIWIGAPDNIRLYDPITASVKVIKVDMMSAAIHGALQCSHIVEDHNGVIWATSLEGLLYFDEKTFQFKRAEMVPEEYRAQMQNAIVEDPEGNLWLSGKPGIFILDKQRKNFYTADNNPEKLAVLATNTGTSFKKFYIDNNGILWMLGHGGGVYRYELNSKRLDRYLFQAPAPKNKKLGTPYLNAALFDITSDLDGNIWVATEQDGIYRYDNQQNRFTVNIRAGNDDAQGLHYDYEANCFLNDRDGHLWIGTDKGINVLSLHNHSFRIFDSRTTFQHTLLRLPEAEVTGLFQSKNGDVYVGYWGRGFSRLNASMELKEHYSYGNTAPAISLPEERGQVWCFAELKNGQVVVGQENGFISVFDPHSGVFTEHLHPTSLQNQTVMHIMVESDTSVWIGLYKNGLARWNPQQNTFYEVPQLVNSINRTTAVMDMVPQNDSLIWLATTTAGLVLLNRNTCQVMPQEYLKYGNLVVNNITCLYKYNDTTLLAGTDHGLWVYNTLRKTSQPLKVNGDVFEEWVLSIEKDTDDKVWFTTQNGFYRFSRKLFSLETFVQADDIIDNNRKVRRHILKLHDGRLTVGASDHFLAFDPAELRVAPPPPDVTIIALKAMDNTVLIEEEERAHRPVVLSDKQNFISIEFKSLQYHYEKIRYYYQLTGIDENWVSAEKLLVAKYTNLPPGNYIFKVRAVNTAGTFSSQITQLPIYITPSFWQTRWFKIVGLLLIAALVYLYFKLRIYNIKKEARKRNAIQQQIAQLEMKALRAQMNPHFIFNALNSIQTFVMKSETEQALAYLSRFARLIRDVLDNSQLNNITIAREVKMLENYMELEKLRFAEQFEYNIIVDPVLDIDFLEIPTMIIQPFVENAIWHGLLHKKERGKLVIAFAKVNDRILCTVTDNGIGRERSAAVKQLNPQQMHHSRGLQITRDRLSLYNSRFNVEASFEIEDIKDEAGNSLGTRVNLWFPLVEE